MGKFWIGCAAVALALAGAARGGTIFTDQIAWEAAVAATGGELKTVSLTPAVVPVAGGMFTDNELDLFFPQNHGGMEVFADGWRGDVHTSFGPPANDVIFHQPTIAFAAMAGVGLDGSPQDAINISIGGTTHKLWRTDYQTEAPAFWGWVGEVAVSGMQVLPGGMSNNYYTMRNVQYVVPEPSATALTLVAAGWCLRRRRSAVAAAMRVAPSGGQLSGRSAARTGGSSR